MVADRAGWVCHHRHHVAEEPVRPEPGQRGTTTETVAGYPAVLQAEWHKIQLDAGTYTVGLTADGYKDGQTEWAPGRKELLIRLAGTLELAPDLGDRATWFDAEQAVPN